MPNKNLIYKTFKFKMKSFHQDDDDFFFEGFLSTFGNVDRGGDVVDKGAFTESLKEHIPPLLFSHDTDEPLGVFDSLEELEEGLFVKARMPLADVFVRDRIIPQMKIGSITSMSIGFSINDTRLDTVVIDNVRHLKKVFLWEGSLVVIPMNAEARIKSKKINVNDLEDIEPRELEEMLKSGSKFSKKGAQKLISILKKDIRDDKSTDTDRDDQSDQRESDEEKESNEMIALIKNQTQILKEQNARNI